MNRIAILTAGGDTPALNATLHGAVARANHLHVEVFGLIKGYDSLLNPRVPHVHLNPLFREIPELDATQGGTILGASRAYVDPDEPEELARILDRLNHLKIDGLICVGGDGTLNGLQPISERIPSVLAPKTIDNDLGLNYASEAQEWIREISGGETIYRRSRSLSEFDLEYMVNYVTPGYATAVFDAAMGIQRIRTTAESHRRIAIVEVMGRHSGYIALGVAYGQPDIILIPEVPLNCDLVAEQVLELYDRQKNVVIVCGEGIKGEDGLELGAQMHSTDPAGNIQLSGAAEALRSILIERIGDEFFRVRRRSESADAAIFTRKVGHTQRGGRPILFDRFYAAQLGGKAVDMLLEGQNNAIATLQWNRQEGFYLDSIDANSLRDQWGYIHARYVHPTFYDEERLAPSRMGTEYLLQIFSQALGHDDLENIRRTLFDSGNLFRPYHSVNTDVARRIRTYLMEPLEKFSSTLLKRGMDPDQARTRVDELTQVLPDDVHDGDRIWWVPGRIELLGKHTDYAGGRSLLAATCRGIWFVVRPRSDCVVRVIDRKRDECVEFELSPELAPRSGWANYPMTVGRRLVRNFGALQGADFFFGSDLPLAAGLSSSSALIVGFSLGLIERNDLKNGPTYTEAIGDVLDLAGYLGTVENGQSFGALEGDAGVGTFGGSEDHTAILTCTGGCVEQYAYCPVRHERSVRFPESLTIAVGASGVVAEKTGNAMTLYNRASRLASVALAVTRQTTGGEWGSLADATRELGEEKVRRVLEDATVAEFESRELVQRFDHFVVESEQLVPDATDALDRCDHETLGRVVTESQSRGARLLGNQVPETTGLCDAAIAEDAVAASAFGAGFGGSVWAAVAVGEAVEFLGRWRARYQDAFPQHVQTSAFFLTRPSGGAFELTAPSHS